MSEDLPALYRRIAALIRANTFLLKMCGELADRAAPEHEHEVRALWAQLDERIGADDAAGFYGDRSQPKK